jgi:YidC/Oxa1 family membrane protein insertase
MDRRTVLAFVLIFLILVGSNLIMQKLFPSKPPTAATPAPTTEQVGTAGSAGSVTTGSPSVPAPAVASGEAGLRLQEAGEARRFVVETPLLRAELDSRGARLVSWRVKSYHDDQGNPVELVPQGPEAAAAGDDAVSFTGARVPLGEVVFASEASGQTTVTTAAASVVFTVRTDGDLEIRKTYTFDPATYTALVDLEVREVGPLAGETLRRFGDPLSARFGWPQGIAETEHDDRVGRVAYKAFAKVGDVLQSVNRKDLAKGADRVAARLNGSVRFALLQNKYFTVAGILPQEPQQVVEGTVFLGGDPVRHQQTWAIEAPLRATPAGGGGGAASRLTLYIGPQSTERLKVFGLGMEKTMDMGWHLLRPLAEAVLWIMGFMYRFVPNYGVVIILFSVFTKLLFYPLTRSSTESMKKMQALQPRIQELQQKYKDNREKMSQEMMKLYQKEKVNPMSGCLPLLIQMPVFFALYQALAHTIWLRNAPFVLWIDDLSLPDVLFTLPFALPLLGSHVSLLPILMSASMWVQSKLTPSANLGGQMALMNTLMPVIFLFMFYQMPSGLVLYWLVNNIMTIYQTWRIHTAAPRAGGVQTA